MSDPQPYSVSYSFGGFQANNPTTPLPGQSVDNELANIAAAITSLDNAVKNVRRADGALQSGIVTFDSLASSLQLTVDPTNGQLVAAAVATAQSAASNSSNFSAVASSRATDANNSAIAAAASASSVNLTLYLPKAGNLAGIGSPNTARANLNAANVDGSDMVGRLMPICDYSVIDWNNFVTNGWGSSAPGAANAPTTTDYWLVQSVAANPNWVTQIAYPFINANVSAEAVTPVRRHSYDNGFGIRAWTPWISYGPVPVGSTIWVNSINAPPDRKSVV